jgi:hypothetical protein
MRLIIATYLITLVSCQNVSENKPTFVNTKHFFEHEITILTEQKTGIEKQVKYGAKTDSLMKYDKVNWEKELQAFTFIDLAKPSNRNTYIVDSSNYPNQIQIKYTSTENKQTLKTVKITKDLKYNIKVIEAVMIKTNSLYQSYNKLRYVTDSGFSIYGKQAVKLGDDSEYLINVKFIH